MAKRGKEIHELRQKVEALGDYLVSCGDIKPPATLHKIAICIGVARETLLSACSKGSVSKEVESKLSAAGDFLPSDPSWYDSDATLRRGLSRRDTAKDFRMLLARRSASSHSANYKVAAARPNQHDENLINFAMSGPAQSWNRDQPIPLILEVIVGTGIAPSSLEYGFSKVRLRLRFGDGSEVTLVNVLGQNEGCQIGDAKLVAEGTRFSVHWYLQAGPNRILRGRYATTETAICELEFGGRRAKFDAVVSVRPMDDATLRHLNGAPIENDVKRSILEILLNEKLGQVDSQGWVVLAQQTLSIDEVINESS